MCHLLEGRSCRPGTRHSSSRTPNRPAPRASPLSLILHLGWVVIQKLCTKQDQFAEDGSDGFYEVHQFYFVANGTLESGVKIDSVEGGHVDGEQVFYEWPNYQML